MNKKIINTFFIVTLIGFFALLSSCKKKIELDEIGGFTSETAILTDADIAALLNSSYFALATDDYYGGSYQVYSELLADHIDGSNLGGNNLGMYTRNTNIFNGDNSSFYAQMSKIVFQSNLTLDNIDKATASNKPLFEGGAKFLRALANFDMVRMYAQPYTSAGAATQAGIPMRLNSIRQPVARSTVGEVYAQIIKDLKDAETMLPATNGVYATKWAAKALLAKVYFQMNEFTNAYTYSNDVITNGGFQSDTSYRQRYSNGRSKEIIFGLVYETNNTQGRFQRLRGNYNTTNAGLPNLRLTNNFYQRATSNSADKRAGWYVVKNTFPLLNKFDSASITLPVLHLTEMRLIRAESAAETNQNLSVAIADINFIINRAYGPASSLLLPTSATAAAIIAAVRRERELELVGEGNRLHELKRRGAKGETVSIRGSAYNCNGLIFPFPNNEVIYSAPLLIQNPIGGCN